MNSKNSMTSAILVNKKQQGHQELQNIRNGRFDSSSKHNRNIMDSNSSREA
jgi:hypothetical protein